MGLRNCGGKGSDKVVVMCLLCWTKIVGLPYDSYEVAEKGERGKMTIRSEKTNTK